MGERIVLGLGNNTDYEIEWNTSTIEDMVREYGIADAELCVDAPIRSPRDLLVSLLGFMKCGSGGERFVDPPSAIEDFARRFATKVTIGGTSVRAAIAMRKLGYRSAFHLVTVNDSVRALIPADSPWVCSNDQDSSYPHLIVQYGEGVEVRAGDIAIRSERPNRLIYDNDADNIAMKLDPGFGKLMEDARVFLVSGFNAMRDAALLGRRLEELKELMRSLPEDATVLYEDACFDRKDLIPQVHCALLPLIDVYSLNEDELQAYLARRVRLLDPEDTLAALEELHRTFRVPTLVVHTRYWALAFGERAGSFGPALKGGITMATSRFRFGDDFDREDYRETEGLPEEAAGKAFAEGIERMAGGRARCVPSVEVRETKVTTIGLGDAFVGGFIPAMVEIESEHEKEIVYEHRHE